MIYKFTNELLKLDDIVLCEDVISREAVHDLIAHLLSDYLYDEDRLKIENLDIQVEDLPSVTPKEKMGRWIKYGIPRCGEQHYKCTSCGYYINFGKWGELYTKEFRYCPNCSAKMTESEE